jgi:beta-galactosidase/beta-glucuronidase
MKSKLLPVLSTFTVVATIPIAQAWQPVGDHIKTRWAQDVSPNRVWPEYPRPELVRSNWTNLNGLWDYAIVDASAPQPQSFDGQILVPFGVESSLSGVGKTLGPNKALWYKRTFARPQNGNQRVLLNFEAVDWDTSVFVNGRQVGEHKGGYDPFSFDITNFLTKAPEQTLVVKVLDATDGYQPRGKQSLTPGGIFYTSTSGIWQTVWLETVPTQFVRSLKILPDVDHQTVHVTIASDAASHGLGLIEVVDQKGIVVGVGMGAANSDIKIRLLRPHLWSPDDPYLYALRVHYGADIVNSYFGMRKIAVAKDEKGYNRFFLNNKPIFAFGPLDQGFWPDGVYTPPTDEAMRYDLEIEKAVGFNAVRKHVKVEPRRWYYWADKLGLLVWQDFPAALDQTIGSNDPDIQRTPEAKAQIEAEMKAMVDHLYNHPSIIMWVAFNEGWGQYDTARIVSLFKQWDPNRLVDDASGWTDRGVGDALDYHSYPSPTHVPLQPTRLALQGEYGGGGLLVDGHLWDPSTSFQYVHFDTAAALQQFYVDQLNIILLNGSSGLAGAIYTQTTDCETEINGIMTYDRILKMDPAVLKAAAERLYPVPNVSVTVLAPSAHDGVQVTWSYTTQPPESTWFLPTYDDSAWLKGIGGFGTQGTPGIVVNTTWNTSDIWVRRQFDLNGPLPENPNLLLYHDEDVDVYLNGTLVATLTGYTTDYVPVTVPSSSLQIGSNELAIHCHQTVGGQGVDAGLIDLTNLNTAK